MEANGFEKKNMITKFLRPDLPDQGNKHGTGRGPLINNYAK